MIPICEEYWLTGKVDTEFIQTLVNRAEKREENSISPQKILLHVLLIQDGDFKGDLNTWLYSFPLPNRPSGIYL